MAKLKATTKNGTPIKGSIRQRLTKNGKLFIDFFDRPKSIKKMNIKAEVKTGNANKFTLDLTIQDVEAQFPNKRYGVIE